MALGFCMAAKVPSGTPWSMASLMAITAACTEDRGRCGEETKAEFKMVIFLIMVSSFYSIVMSDRHGEKKTSKRCPVAEKLPTSVWAEC